MQSQKSEYIPWRDRAFVSIAEAAEIVSRSPDWIRNRIGEGRLRGCRVTAGGPLVVTAASLTSFVDNAMRESPTRARPAIYLAWDNS